MRVTVVDGTTFVGEYASDGSFNVVESNPAIHAGAYHACGALLITVVDGSSFVGVYAANGSINVIEDETPGAYHECGALKVTGNLFSPFSQAIFDAFTTPPTSARKQLINTFVEALIAGGVWDELDVLYVFAAADSQAALVNWKTPNTFDGVLANAPTFTADEGFTGNGSNAHVIVDGYLTSSPGINFTQNAAHTATRVLVSATEGVMGRQGLLGNVGLDFRINPLLCRFNAESVASFSAPGDLTSHFVYLRPDANNVAAYVNGVFHETVADTATNLGSDFAFLGVPSTGSYTTAQLASGSIGGALTAPQIAAYAAAELTYMQAVGAVA